MADRCIYLVSHGNFGCEGDQLEVAVREVQGPDVGRSSLETFFRANPFLRMSCVVGKKKCH
jgi:hypothetical protein